MPDNIDNSTESVTIPNDENSEVVETTEKVPVQSEPSESEVTALEKGWRPKEEYEGDPKKWVDADEFLRRGELFEKIDLMGRELRDTKKTLRMLQTHHDTVRETEFQRAIQELKLEKKQAYEEGDHEKVVELDDKLLDIRIEQKNETAAAHQQSNQPDPRFVSWVNKNQWYAKDEELRAFSDEVGVSHAKSYPDKSPEEVLQYVETRVRKAFPDKFNNLRRTAPGAVLAGGKAGSAGKKEEYALSEDEHKIMMNFVRQGVMTKEKYIEDLKKIKGE
jgi:hypothetical protein